jgi:hypothetical protein
MNIHGKLPCLEVERAACDAELHEAFDLSYDYDGRTELEAA